MYPHTPQRQRCSVYKSLLNLMSALPRDDTYVYSTLHLTSAAMIIVFFTTLLLVFLSFADDVSQMGYTENDKVT